MEKLDDINLAYDVFESVNGSNSNLAPVVFLHGFASDRKTWADIPFVIAEKTARKVYSYDARNYGDSDFTDEFNLPLVVDDVFHFMNIVNIQKAVLVGHSLGSYTTLHAALKKPEKVEMIIIEDTYLQKFTEQQIWDVGDYMQSLSQFIKKTPSSLDESDATKYVNEEMYETLSEENRKWAPKESVRNLGVPFKKDHDGRYRASYNEKIIYESTRSAYNWQMEPTGIYKGPSIFFCGKKSPLDVMKHKSHITEHFPNAEFIEFEEGYHSLHSLLRDQFIDAVVQVLNEC